MTKLFNPVIILPVALFVLLLSGCKEGHDASGWNPENINQIEIMNRISNRAIITSRNEISLIAKALKDSKPLTNKPSFQPADYTIGIRFTNNGSKNLTFSLETMEEGYYADVRDPEQYYLLTASATRKLIGLLAKRDIMNREL